MFLSGIFISRKGVSGNRGLSKKNSRLVLLLVLIATIFIPGMPTLSMAAAVKWKEQDGEIQLKSVCYNHNYGSIVYRQCRADAQKQFKGRCSHFSRQLEYATGSQRAGFKKSEHKYCYAARHLSIVN